MISWWLACNTAPVHPSGTPAPGSDVPWSQPSEDGCEDHPVEGSFVVEGFTFCPVRGGGPVPVDEPVHAACADVTLPDDTDVLWATDGLTARAWPTAMLQGRELVHEDWPLGPVLVDW